MLLLVPPQELGSGPVMRKFLFRLSRRSDGNAFTLPHACGSVPCRARKMVQGRKSVTIWRMPLTADSAQSPCTRTHVPTVAGGSILQLVDPPEPVHPAACTQRMHTPRVQGREVGGQQPV